MIVVNVFKIATDRKDRGQSEKKKEKDDTRWVCPALLNFFFFLESSLKISAYIDCVPWSLLSKWDWKTAFKCSDISNNIRDFLI